MKETNVHSWKKQSVANSLVDTFLHRRSYDLDMLGFCMRLHASPIGFNGSGSKQSMRMLASWRNDPSFFYSFLAQDREALLTLDSR